MERPILIVASKNDKELLDSVRAGFARKFGAELDFEVNEDKNILGGFIAVIDGNVYDASFAARFNELGQRLKEADKHDTEIKSSLTTVAAVLKRQARAYEPKPLIYEYGIVQSCNDDIVQISGLKNCRYGELLSFDGGAIGLALDLRLGSVGAALLSGEVLTSSLVHATGHIAQVCVGDEIFGRVIDPLGKPLDGRELNCTKSRPIESPAPTITQRAPIDSPLETGILAIDSMIPIGRGQRELILGDRQTGKTAIALSAIMNQRGKNVQCVYCAIGQKASTVSSVRHMLEKAGAMDYTVIVSAFGDDTAAMQYLAPYAACAIAEEFAYSGRDALVVYDDLSKHAVAYRTISLLLRRPSGREAYPGDIFYLHSRLLERASKLSPALGGGSLTALPIVETLAGDISAYVPTNVISITDGQIYLETNMFNSGQRPAINVGLSVSRVGRAAQTKALREVSGSLRLEVAQYREISVFAQFGADIDKSTAKMLTHGERLMRLLIQPVGCRYKLSEQVALLLAASQGLFEEIETRDMAKTVPELISFLTLRSGAVMENIDKTATLSEEDREALIKAFGNFSNS